MYYVSIDYLKLTGLAGRQNVELKITAKQLDIPYTFASSLLIW